ncbi:MAG: Gfo/Idh/MocA family oxidoreductase [Sedimentisphaerales bacterium]|nr:Gfo/Idh/MocA family oxidoreductase [Sedimentisphaerales bacterium]
MAVQNQKVGVIGFGIIARELCRNFLEIGNHIVDITAVVDPSDDNYALGCKILKISPRRYASVPDMLQEEELDGVIVAAPNNLHLEIIRRFEGLDIPILLEKPLDANYDNICDVLRFSQTYPGKIVVDHCMRYAPIVIKAKQLIRDNEIGRVCSFNFVQNCHYGNTMYRNFRRTMAGGGGMFVEKATHDFDILIHLLEAKPVRVAAIAKRQVFGGTKSNDLTCGACPESISCPSSIHNISLNYGVEPMEAQGQNKCVYAQEIDVPDNEACLIDFENDIFGSYSECYFTPSSCPSREYEIIGSKGILKISFTHDGDDNHGRVVLCQRFATPGDKSVFDFDYRNRIHYNGGHNVARHFYQLMTTTAHPMTTVQQAFAAETLAHAATLAYSEDKFINIRDVLPGDLRSAWLDGWEKDFYLPDFIPQTENA